MRWWEPAIAALLLLVLAPAAQALCTQSQAEQSLSAGTSHKFTEWQDVDYVLVLDRSGSMKDGKLDRAKDAAGALVESLSRGDRAAIASFDSRAFTHHRLSGDKESLMSALDSITIGDFTRYTKGLTRGATLFDGNRKVMVFLSDGRPDDDESEIMEDVDGLIGADVCLFTIAYAESADESAQKMLKSMADRSLQATGCGGYFRAADNDFELEHIFSRIYEDVSSDALLDVTADIDTSSEVVITARVNSALNGADLAGTCFSPEYTLTIVQNNDIVAETTTDDPRMAFELAPGDYDYYLSAKETCGGDCLFTGRSEGTFNVDPSAAACPTPWSTLSTVLSSEDYTEIHITKSGFSPQTVSSDGMVVWRNLDDKDHRVTSLDGSWESPLLSSGDSWSWVFPPGSYAYRLSGTSFSGALNHDSDRQHRPVDLVLVLDRSGSMAGAALQEAKSAAQNLIGVLDHDDRAALVVFSDRAHIAQPMTSDKRSLRKAVDGVLSEGSTFYIEPLRLAGQQFARATGGREQAVIFLSDGSPFDAGAPESILDAVESEISPACLFSIGYGEEGVEAIELLSSMVSRARQSADCGAFYFSTADKASLSKVFGEVYASLQDPGLEIYDVTISSRGDDKVLSARVRSRANGLMVPSTSDFGCVPPASVDAVFGEKRFPLGYVNGTYTGVVDLGSGSHDGFISARLTASDDDVRSVVGQVPITVSISGSNWLLWLSVIGGLVGVAYVFMARRNPSGRGTPPSYQRLS